MSGSFWLLFFFFVLYCFVGVFFTLFFGFPNNGQDFIFHWNAINGSVSNYKPFFHWFFSFINFNSPFSFYVSMVFLVCGLIPFLLYKITKSFFSVFLYFFGVSLPHNILYAATYPMAFVLFLFLFYLLVRRKFFVLIFPLWLVASLSHNEGFSLFALVFVAELFSYCFPIFKKWVFVYSFVDFEKCFAGTAFLLPQALNSVKNFVALFLDLLPVPTFLLSLKKLDIFYSILLIGSFVGSMVNLRAIALAQLVCVILGSYSLKEFSGKKKWFFIFLLIIWGGLIIVMNIFDSYKLFLTE